MKFLSRKFLIIVLTIVGNAYLLMTGHELPEELTQNILVLTDSLVAIYLIIQGIVDSKK